MDESEPAEEAPPSPSEPKAQGNQVRPESAGSPATSSRGPKSFAQQLADLKEQGKELARLHHSAKERAAKDLPRIGALVDAEEELEEALKKLWTLSPLLLLDGAEGVGKSSILNALLQAALPAEVDESCSTSSEPSKRSRLGALPLGRPGGRAGRPLIARAPPVPGPDGSASPSRRLLEGRPTLGEGKLRELSEEEWAQRLSGQPSSSSEASKEQEELPPLVLEDPGLQTTLGGSSLWLVEVNLEAACSSKSAWLASCEDAICVVRAAGGGSLSLSDEDRLRRHLEAGRRVLLVVNHCDAELEPPLPAAEEIEAKLRELHSSEEQPLQVHALSALRANSPGTPWATAWTRFQASLSSFARGAEEQRLLLGQTLLADAREAFVQWCTQGAKVVSAAAAQFKQDGEDLRLARDLITRNIDDAYLAHVFSSVLVGKFDSLCVALSSAPAPDLGGRWGRHATRQVMEAHLRDLLEAGLRSAMQHSLEEVTAEMAKQELPALLEIQRIARRGASLPWDAQVRELEVDLRPDQLQHFALHFFGSVSVGVLSGIGALALEALLGELALGPVGLVAGVATFVAIGVQNADWPSVRQDFVKQVRQRHLELVEKARSQLDFPGLCERRRRRILEKMDVILQRLLTEVASLSTSASEFAQCALVLQQRPGRH